MSKVINGESQKENLPSLVSCAKCNNTGWYQYSTIGTPHFTICDICCKHDKGFSLLEEHYGPNNGKWCCMAGCGFMKDTNENS